MTAPPDGGVFSYTKVPGIFLDNYIYSMYF